MPVSNKISGDPWPALPYAEFAGSQHLLHMALQAIGKLKLQDPFQPQWAEVPLWLSATGLTTGPVSYAGGAYEVTADFISHQVKCATSWGFAGHFELHPMAVAEFWGLFLGLLRNAGVDVSINSKPQEVPDPIPFDQDKEPRHYEPATRSCVVANPLEHTTRNAAFSGTVQGQNPAHWLDVGNAGHSRCALQRQARFSRRKSRLHSTQRDERGTG